MPAILMLCWIKNMRIMTMIWNICTDMVMNIRMKMRRVMSMLMQLKNYMLTLIIMIRNLHMAIITMNIVE